MSWNTVSELSEVRNLTTTLFLLHLKEAAKDNSSMSGESSCHKENMDLEWESESDEDEDDSEMGGLLLMFSLGTLLQHNQIYTPIEDNSIVFGGRVLIADLNESQCLKHFQFRKEHLLQVTTSL